VSFAEERLAAWSLALLFAAYAHAWGGQPGRRAAGLGIMTVPLWQTLIGILESIAPLVQGGTVLPALSPSQLSDAYIFAILPNLGYLGAGFLLYASHGANWRGMAVPQLAQTLRKAGLPMGRRSEGQSAAAGIAIVPLLALASYLLVLATQGIKALNNGDESQYWRNMTVYHAVLISAAAALGEELLFRGLLQTLLAKGFSRLRGAGADPAGWAVVPAIVVQAIVFGFAHAGYGTFEHVLTPLLFGLLAGLLAWRWGIWSSILLHFLADTYTFLQEAAPTHLVAGILLDGLFAANLAFALAWLLRRASTWRGTARRPLA
jgi:membrane protease YdiL (CAAX protease family)